MERVSQEKYEQSNEYLYSAMEEMDFEKREALLMKALEINEFNTDAVLELSKMVEHDFLALGMLNEAVSIAEHYLEEAEGISANNEDHLGNFWVILETRPYMRAKAEHLQKLIDVGYLLEAQMEAAHLLMLSESDNLGIRYIAQGINVYTSNYEFSSQILEQYEEESFMLHFPHVLVCLDNDKEDEAKNVMKNLLKRYPFALDVLRGEYEFSDEDYELAASDTYAPFSPHEVLTTYAEFIDILPVGFHDWLEQAFARH